MSKFRTQLEKRKSESTLQLLFKAARLANERAIARLNQRTKTGIRLRPAHTALFPHLDFEGVRPTDLASRLGVSKQAVAPLLLDLENMGLIEKVPDPSDGRAKLVRYSKKGGEQILGGLALLGEVEEELAQVTGTTTMLRLRRTLSELVHYLESEEVGRF